MEYTAQIIVRRSYEAHITANSLEEAKKLASMVYAEDSSIDYEDELLDIYVTKDENGE